MDEGNQRAAESAVQSHVCGSLRCSARWIKYIRTAYITAQPAIIVVWRASDCGAASYGSRAAGDHQGIFGQHGALVSPAELYKPLIIMCFMCLPEFLAAQDAGS